LCYFALLEPFETLHKCSGESQAVKQALTGFVVHLCEAGRLQSVLKDVCENSLDNTIESLDSRCPNSFWINEYGDLGGQEIYMQVGRAFPQARWANPPHKPARRLNLSPRRDATYARQPTGPSGATCPQKKEREREVDQIGKRRGVGWRRLPSSPTALYTVLLLPHPLVVVQSLNLILKNSPKQRWCMVCECLVFVPPPKKWDPPKKNRSASLP
jgi:hypothetical protein